MTEFLVEQTIVESEDELESPVCPYCFSGNVRTGGTMTTLVVSYGKYDANHRWTVCDCNKCGKQFTWERKGNNVWYTRYTKILRGMAACFETYVYTHAGCGGDVIRTTRNKSDNAPTSAISYKKNEETGVWETDQYDQFSCGKCGASVDLPQGSQPTSAGAK